MNVTIVFNLATLTAAIYNIYQKNRDGNNQFGESYIV